MKQYKRFLAILMVILICVSASACGGSSAASSDSNYGGADVGYDKESPGATGEGLYGNGSDSWTEDSPSLDSEGGSVYQNSDVKLIRTAYLMIQTTDFDTAVTALEALVRQYSGYFQDAQVNSGSYNSKNSSRTGSYTIRVPAEHYDGFLAQADGVGHLARKTETSEDVGEAYYDLEARLKTQRTKQERLLSLLEKAETMEDIIMLESALSEVEYQIEQYSSQLNRYDGLIGYATFTVDLYEVNRIVDEPTQKDSLLTRIQAGFVSSFEDFAEGIQDMLVWFSYNLLSLMVMAAGLCAAVLILRRIFRGIRRKKNTARPDDAGENR